jgi:hypothetical protein
MTADSIRSAQPGRRAFVRAAALLGLAAAALPLGGCASLFGIEDPNAASSEQPVEDDPAQPSGSADFEGLLVELNLDQSTWSWSQINNTASANNGALVVGIPMTATNNDEQTRVLSGVYCKVTGPTGQTQADISGYYPSDDILQMGSISVGAVQQGVIHVLFQGPGTYTVQFDNLLGRKTQISVEIASSASSGLKALPAELSASDAAGAIPAGQAFDASGLTLTLGADESVYWWVQSWDSTNEVWNGRWCVGVPLTIVNTTTSDLVFSAESYALYAPGLYRLDDPAPWFAESGPAAYVGTVGAGQSVQVTLFWPYVENGLYYACFDNNGVKVVASANLASY